MIEARLEFAHVADRMLTNREWFPDVAVEILLVGKETAGAAGRRRSPSLAITSLKPATPPRSSGAASTSGFRHRGVPSVNYRARRQGNRWNYRDDRKLHRSSRDANA
jgi:hypothetical protein